MNEQPEKATAFDFLPKIVDRFRNLHLRHMMVTDIHTGKMMGMINIGDVFKHMPL